MSHKLVTWLNSTQPRGAKMKIFLVTFGITIMGVLGAAWLLTR
jgi:hypothetical protein